MIATAAKPIRRLLSIFAVVVFAATVAACSGQASEISGNTLDDAFEIVDDTPVLLGSNKHRQLVFSDDDGEFLSTLAIKFGDDDNFEIGTPVALHANSSPMIEATVGDLVTFERDDGLVIKSSENFRTSNSVSGEVTFETTYPFFAGTFSAEMDDGGHVEGVFVVVP